MPKYLFKQAVFMRVIFLLFFLFGIAFANAQGRLPSCNGNYEGPCHFIGPTKIDGVDTGHRYDGDVRNSDFNGNGTMTYKNGDRYVGKWKDGLRDGQGTLYKKDGTIERGVWRSDELVQDQGSTTPSNSSAIPPVNSQFPSNQKKLPDCVVGFVGPCYFEGNMTKAGQSSADRYEGEMLNNLPHGQGIYYYQDNTADKGNRYQGHFNQGIREGKGAYYWSNGDRYVGDFKNNQFEGTGTKTFNGGSKYVGEWKNNVIEGQGTMIYAAEGDRYEGQWKNDNRHGNGTYSYGDGTRYVGGYQSGKKNGYGTLYKADGSIDKQGIWKDGNLVQSQSSPPSSSVSPPKPPVTYVPIVPVVPPVKPKPPVSSPPVESKFQINRKRCLGMGLEPGTESYRKCME